MTETVNMTSIQEQEKEQKVFGKVLVVGIGSTSGTVIPTIDSRSKEIICTTRPSDNGRKAKEELSRTGNVIKSEGLIEGEGKIDRFHLGIDLLQSESPPNTILLCTPNQNYASNIQQLHKAGMISKGQTIVGISTRLGSGTEIAEQLAKLDENPDDFNIVSYSTYYAATKPIKEKRTTVNTRAVKNKIYVGSTKPHSTETIALKHVLNEIGTNAEIIEGTLGAEVFNANTFVHAQLILSRAVLDDVFSQESVRDYIYRDEPEGAVSEESMLRMAQSENEINKILLELGYPQPNLLDMLQNDLYPTPNLSTDDINNYPTLGEDEKAKLLHMWFRGRQTDPQTSRPHLKAVKLQRVYKNDSGALVIPRIPGEDFSGIVLFTELGKKLGIETPALTNMRNAFEEKIKSIKDEVALDLQSIESEMNKIAESTVKSNI